MAKRPKRTNLTEDHGPRKGMARYLPDDGPYVVREAETKFGVYYVAIVKIGELERPPGGAYAYRTPDGRWFTEAWQAAAHMAEAVEVSVRQVVRPAPNPKAAPDA